MTVARLISALVIAALLFVGLPFSPLAPLTRSHSKPVHASGSQNLWANGQAGNRANIEWRTDSYGGGKLLRRSLFDVYMQTGEVLLMGSSAMGLGTAEISVFNPGTVTGPIGTETIPAPNFTCSAQRTLSGIAAQGKITSRAQELAGPDTVPSTPILNSYTPCTYTAPSTGVYNVAFYGPSGPGTAADGSVGGDVALAAANDFSAAQGSSIAAWDMTVRSGLASPTNITGRVFTYYANLFTGGNGLPVFPTVYAVTTDGFRYQIDLRGMDPNAWISYGNQVGFYDSDGTTPLYHDAVAANIGAPGRLTNIQGGVSFALPTFPLFFETPAPATITALGIPLTPTGPVVSAATFAGNVSGNTSNYSSGGTFSYSSNVGGVYEIVISHDGIDFDPTTPLNRSLRGVRPAGGQTVTWDGKDNLGNFFPAGSYTTQVSIHAGEYHFPMIDVENDVSGGPTITLTNPISGLCPSWTGGCKGAFYDDRAYKTISGVTVDGANTPGLVLCGNNPPATTAANGTTGYDTSTNQRGFGAASGGNTNVPCTGNFGDAKGLDMWTYTPSSNVAAPLNILPPSADVALTKTVDVPFPAVGSNVVFTVTAKNNGPNDATGVQVTDLLPAGLTYVSSTVTTGTYTSGTGLWNIGPLANGVTQTLTITATVNVATPITNTANKTAQTEADPNSANDTASASINPSADIKVTKIVDNATPNFGTNITYTIKAQNLGPSNATGVVVTDTLPAGLTYVSSSTATGTYNNGTGLWTIGGIANGVTDTLTITATVNTTSFTTNTATKTAENEPDPVAGNDTASVGLTPQAAALGIAKIVDNATPNFGSNITFTVSVTNYGPSPANGVTVNDVLPAGATYISSNTVSGTYNNGTGLWNIGTMAVGSVVALTLTAKVTGTVLANNTATIATSSPPDPGGHPHTASASFTPLSADIAVTKVVNNATPNVGSNVTFTITATNNGPSNATGVVIHDALPAGLTYVSNATASGSYNNGTGDWTIGNLNNGVTATLTITATATSTSLVTNTAARTASSPPDPNAANDSASIGVTGQAADLSIFKVVDNATPNVGSNVTYTLTASNAGPSNATGVVVTDNLPAGVTYVSSSTATGSYNNGTGLWTIGAMAVGATATLTITVKVTVSGNTLNTATITGSQPDPFPGNNSSSVNVNGQAADIAVTKIVNNATPNLNSNVTFTITANNNGPNNATGVIIHDALPAGLTYVSSATVSGSYNNGTGDWSIGNLNNGVTATLTITATVTVASVTNTATRTASTPPDLNAANDTSSVTVNAVSADLGITKIVNNATPSVGSNVIYTLTATNAGPNNATGVKVTDNLSGNLTYVSSSTVTGSYNSGTGIWTIGALANGATATLTITATVNVAGPTNNTSTIAGNETDINLGNNTSSVGITGQAADIAINKTVNNASPNLGSNVTYTITATNNGPNNASGVTVTDNLPAGATYVSSSTVSGSYNNGTGIWNIGNLNNGVTATLTITAQITTVITQTNTASRTTSSPTDTNAANDSSSVAVTAVGADLSITKVVDNATPNVGSNVIYTLNVTNNGPSAATGVTATDNPPAGLSYVSSSTVTGSYSNGTGIWTIGGLANGATATLTITAKVTGTAPITNSATVTAVQFDPNLGNNSSSVLLTPQSADISITKSVNNASPNFGSNVIYTIVAQNLGPNNATGVIVHDALPAGLTYVSNATVSGSYNNGTGDWTIGALANGATASLTITATVNSTTIQTNTAARTASSPPDPNAANDSSSVSLTPLSADISVLKTVNNATPNLGSNVTYTITATNNGPNNATGVIIHDALPVGVTYVSNATVSGSYSNGTGDWSIGALANGVTATLTITGTINSTTPQTNTASRTASTPPDPNAANDTSSVGITPVAADLAINKSVSNPTPNFGSNVTYTLFVTNNGPSNATGVTVTDTLPASLTFVSAAGGGVYNAGTRTITWSVGNLANAANTSLTFVATINSTSIINNTATVTATQPDPTLLNNSSTVSLTPQSADIAVTKIVDNASPNVGSNVTFTITATNNGPNNATGVVVHDALPAGLTYVSNATASGSYNNGTGDWSIGALANGVTATLTITATSTSTTLATNTASRTASTPPDTNPANDSSSVGVTGQAADLVTVKVVNNATPNVGTNVTYTLTATNNGPSNATGVVVTDNLPAGVTYVSSSTVTGSYNNGTGLWTIGALANGATATLTITVKVTVSGLTTNSASITGNQPDPFLGNNTSSVNIDGQAADIAVTKVVDNATPNLNTNVTFTITATNNGPNNATGVIINDVLPAGLTYVSNATLSGSYNNGTGDWTIGNLNNGVTATLTITTTSTSTSLVTNTATRTASNPTDTNPANDSASVGVTGLSTDLAINKTVDNAAPNVGANVTYTLTATNNGPSNATGVVVTDNLPAGVTYVSSSTVTGSYNSGTGLWSIGALANGATAVLTITVTVNVSGISTNTSTITGNETDTNLANNTSSVNIDGQAADIAVTKVVDNATPNLGSNITYTITATNNGPNNATGVVINDVLPPGLTYVSNATASGSYNNGTGDWTIGNLNNGVTATLTITATVATVVPTSNTASRTASTPPDLNAANDTSSVGIIPVAADLAIGKTVNNATPDFGTNVVYTLTLVNNGPSNATNVVVADTLPAGMTYVSSSATQGAYTPGPNTWVIGALANSGIVTLTITATVNTTSPTTNTATVSATEPDQNLVNNTSSVSVTPQSADIAVTKVVDNATPNLNSNVTFTITATNNGPNNATGVIINDVLPAGLTYVSNATVTGSYNNGTGDWTIGALANGVTATLTITATSTSTTLATNTATRTASTPPDPNAANDSASAGVTGLATDLAINKTVNNPTPNVGTNVTYTLTATNNGPSDATGVVVTDNLPGGVTYISNSALTGSYDNLTGLWTIGALANGATATLTITVSVDVSGISTNTSTITGNETDTDLTNNTSSVDVDGQAADIAVIKVVDNATPNLNTNVTFTITATNNGPNDASTVTVNDLMPAGLTYVSNTVSQGSYSSVSGNWSLGGLANGVTATLTITATSTSTSLVTNTATRTASNPTDINPANDSASVGVTGLATDLAINKTVNNATPNVGTNVTYTLTATNNGPSNATGVVATDNLPAGVTYVSSSTVTGSYNSGTGLWTIGALANRATATLTITVTVNVAGISTNTSTITGNETDTNLGNNTSSINIDGQQADLFTNKTVSPPTTANVGSNVTYTITAGNNGPSSATGVTVTDNLPAGVTFVSFTSTQGGYSSITGIWNVGTLVSGQAETLSIIATVNAAGIITNNSNITGSQPDPDPTNNTSTASFTGLSADIAVLKTVNNATPYQGDNVVFSIVATNNGPSPATGVAITDTLPAGLTYVSSSTLKGTFSSVTGIWSVGSLANGANATLLITAKANNLGSITNTAFKSAENESDPNLANDTSSVSITVIPQADIQVLLSASNINPNWKAAFYFTVTATNLGPSDATGVAITDLIPAGFTYVSNITPLGQTYDPVTGIWTIGPLALGGATQLRLNVIASSIGTFTDTATKTAEVEHDPNLLNDTASLSIDPAAADIAVSKTASLPVALIGQNVTYTITAKNNGPSDATGVNLTDVLPTSLAFVSATTSQGSYDPNTGLWNMGSLKNGASATLSIVAKVLVVGNVTNTASRASADQPDPTPQNDVSAATVTSFDVPGFGSNGSPALFMPLLFGGGFLLMIFVGMIVYRRRQKKI